MDSTNTAKTVPAPAVVLMDEPEGADSSPPVGPAPDNLANLAGRIIDDDFGSDDLDNDNIDDDIFEDDRPLTPETRRQRLVALTAVLMALGEWQDALKAVLDTPESTKADDPTCWACDWYADVAHLLFFAETWRSILRGYSMGGMDDATNAECKRRREAFARGELHCGCPVLWAERALDQIVDTLEKHGEDMLGDPAIEAPHLAWALEQFKVAWNDGAGRRMNRAAKREMLKRVNKAILERAAAHPEEGDSELVASIRAYEASVAAAR